MIPTLNIGRYLDGEAGADKDLAAQLSNALREIGFFSLVNHGVPQALIDAVFEQARRFHALPLERKMSLRINSNLAGYQPLRGSVSRASTIAGTRKQNLNEAFFIHGREEYNQWPEDLPGFREIVSEYQRVAEALCRRLLSLYACALGMSSGYFRSFFEGASSIFRLAHYPLVPAEDNQYASAPHTDASFMTLLPDNEIAGLAIRPKDGDWLDVPRIPGSFLVNSGDILRRWSNDRFLSTEHKVHPMSGRERYAIPFFFGPSRDTKIECLPTCRNEGDTQHYPPVVYGAYQDWHRGQNFYGAESAPPP